MTNVQYEKPRMKFVDLRNKQMIADTDRCMAIAAKKGGPFYYDVPGDGWVKIFVPKNCSGDTTQMSFAYVDNEKVPGTISEEAQRAAENAARDAVEANKQQFVGDLFPENPDGFSQ
ncbi:MAG: hypothetical protein PUF76_08255 [bacterium]|nr:hypothetical protein [bacterium]